MSFKVYNYMNFEEVERTAFRQSVRHFTMSIENRTTSRLIPADGDCWLCQLELKDPVLISNKFGNEHLYNHIMELKPNDSVLLKAWQTHTDNPGTIGPRAGTATSILRFAMKIFLYRRFDLPKEEDHRNMLFNP